MGVDILNLYDTFNSPVVTDFMRLVGRVGFILLVFAVYKLWQGVSSPLLRNRTKLFVRIFSLVIFTSFVFGVVDYLANPQWLHLTSITFNVIVTYVLAWYVNRQADVLRRATGTSEYVEYSTALDNLMMTLKRR